MPRSCPHRFILTSWARGALFPFLTIPILLVVIGPVVAQEVNSQPTGIAQTEAVQTVTGRVDLTESGRRAWSLSETDWAEYRRLMSGPSGLWYPHLDPAFVLGINAKSDSERERFARIVYDQERRRLNQLFAFNRAIQEIARAERSSPDFDFFGELDVAADNPGAPLFRNLSRPLLFVGPGCPVCDMVANGMASAGRAMDIYYVGAASDDEISSWAGRVRVPPELVRSRVITLNHDLGALSRAGRRASELPLVFSDPSMERTVPINRILRGGPGE